METNNSLKPTIEINRAYYPLIARLCLIWVGIDVLFFIAFLLVQSANQQQILVWVIIYLAKVIALAYITTRGAYAWTAIYYHIDIDAGLLVKNEGLHFAKKTTYNLQNLHSVSSSQGPIGKPLKYGDLSLTFTNREGNKEEIKITEVVDPKRYKEFFDSQLKQGGN